MNARLVLLSAALLLGAGCVEYEENPDAGSPDASVDAGTRDASTEEAPDRDGGDRDASVELPDAGWDAGDSSEWICNPDYPKWWCNKPPIDPGGPTETPEYPGSMIGDDPGTALLFFLRIDRGTANLADSYQTLITTTLNSLDSAGIHVRVAEVVSLYDGSAVDISQGIANGLRAAAAASTGYIPDVCTTHALAAVAGSGTLPTVSVFLGVLIDSGARPHGLNDAACAESGNSPASYFLSDPAAWLVTDGVHQLPRPQVRFIAIHTPEAGTPDDMRKACNREPNVVTTALDQLEVSPIPFFKQWSDGAGAIDALTVKTYDYCPSVFDSTGWYAYSRA